MIEKTIKLMLTSQEIATEFCNLDNHQQANFFNEVGRIIGSWPGNGYSQVTAFIGSEEMDKNGLELLRYISEEMNYEYVE